MKKPAKTLYKRVVVIIQSSLQFDALDSMGKPRYSSTGVLHRETIDDKHYRCGQPKLDE